MIEQSKIEQVARAIDPGRWKLLDSLMTPGHEADVLELPLAVQSLNQARVQQLFVERGLAQHDPATGVVVWLDDGTPVFMEDGE